MDQQVYEGQIVDGIPDGEGRKIFKDGSLYTGIMILIERTIQDGRDHRQWDI